MRDDHHEQNSWDSRALSVGGVVLRDSEDGLQVVILRRGTQWFLPKGTPERWEDLERTALREVAEETGLEVRMVVPIGQISYRFAAVGGATHRLDGTVSKTVLFYVMRATGGDLSRHDGEYEEVRWARIGEALTLLSFKNYCDVLERGIREWRRIGMGNRR